MANWFNVASSAISGAASVLGIPWQKKMQEELMDRNAAINLEQWRRETAYNSPIAQMQRLREAGLNPDLAIGGNVANAASSAQLTDGTPQAPGAASAVAQAVRNAQSGLLVDSEINKNESEAKRNEASAGESTANTVFKWSTMDNAVEQVAVTLGLSKQQTLECTARTNYFGQMIEESKSRMDHLVAQVKLLNEQFVGQRKHNQLLNVEYEMAMKRFQRADEYINNELNLQISQIGLNNAAAASYRANTSLLWATYKAQVNLANNMATSSYWNAFTSRENFKYQQGLNKQLSVQLDYLPYQYIDLLFNATKLCETDKDGNIIFDKNGMPKIRDGYANFMRVMDMGSAMLDNVEKLSLSAYFVAGAVGQIKGFSFGGPTVNTGNGPVSPIQQRPATKKEEDMFLRWYKTDAANAFNRIVDYKHKHNIQ